MFSPTSLGQLSDLLIDSYFVIDREFNIVDFNRPFLAMLPRPVGRSLKAKKCYEVLNLSICKEGCIAKQCWSVERQVRLDEITGRISGEEQDLRFILSAVPLRDESGAIIGAVEMQRNVTDEAAVQVKYQTQMEASAREQKRLEEALRTRTRRLLEISRRLHVTQKELVRLKAQLG